METRSLGATGLPVPVVGLGTWRTFDVRGAAAERGIRAVVDEALESGANLFDSSPMYGEAERVLGEALGPRRSDALIATKVWASSATEGRRQVDRAMRLCHGRVDLYQIHNLASWREHLPMLEAECAAGRIGVVGALHYSPGAFGELVPGSVFERNQAKTDPGTVSFVVRHYARPPAQLAPLRAFGVTTWTQALLKWILSDPRCHTTIPATSKPQRVVENAAAGGPPWFGRDERAYVAKLFE